MTQPDNPFTSSNALPLNDPLFRGRAAELDRLVHACLKDHGRFIVVYGGRQNGKTTLLLRLEERLSGHSSAGVRVCHVDFQGAPSASAQDAYRLLARSVTRALPQAAPLPDLLDAPALADFLEAILAGQDVHRLVLLLDELSTLPEITRVELSHVLRSLHTRRLMSQALAKLQVVLFGGIKLYNLAVAEASGLHNVVDQLILSDLGEPDAVSLIADGLALVGLEEDSAIALGQAVYARMGGHPYLTQRLGELLAERALTAEPLGATTVDTLAWELLERRDPLLDHLCRAVVELRLEEGARRLLSACERTSRTDDTTARLELLGLARRAERHWVPRCPLLAVALAEWLGVPGTAAAAPLPDVAVEVQRTAAVYHLHDLKDEHAAVTARISAAPTVEEQLRLQRRARKLAGEIVRVEEMQQTSVVAGAPPPPPREIARDEAVQQASATPAAPPASPSTPTLVPRPVSRTVPALPPWVPALVKVPAGPFLMGSADIDKLAMYDEKPQHRLELPDFWIGRTPVTNAQFRPFVEGDGYTNRAYWTKAEWMWRQRGHFTQPEYWTDSTWNEADYPVVGVSWFEAMAYCRWLGAQTGMLFRLPSEAEWEKAARGPNGLIWPWGNRWEARCCNSKEAGLGRTSPVGQYPSGASPCGALDMAGNVYEWCTTRPGKSYPYRVEDEWADAYLEANTNQVLRGGSWCEEQQDVRGACRNHNIVLGVRISPLLRDDNVGLRVISHSPRPDAEF